MGNSMASRKLQFERHLAKESMKETIERERQERELIALANSGDKEAASQLIKNMLNNPANFAEPSKKTGGQKKRSRGATQSEFERPVVSTPEACRPTKRYKIDIEKDVLEPQTITAWCEGQIILKDIDDPLPGELRSRDDDPDEITTIYAMICWYAKDLKIEENCLTVSLEKI